MSRFKGFWTRFFKPNTTYFVDLLIAATLLIQGIYELVPGLQVPQHTVLNYLGSERAEISLALVQIGTAGLLFYHFLTQNRLAGRIGTFIAFLVFSFLGLLGFLADVNALYWLMAGTLAFVCGAMHIRLGWGSDE